MPTLDDRTLMCMENFEQRFYGNSDFPITLF